MQITTV